MGKGRQREERKWVSTGSWSDDLSSSLGPRNIPAGPVFYPSEEEFKDPLDYINMIRPEAEPYGICKIVPPSTWKPPFALDMDSFTFPTKTQAIHQLQARCASCDPKTFALDYNRFLEKHCGKKAKKRVVFEGDALDLCKLFNAVKRFGGYDAVTRAKKWGEVFRFVRRRGNISECSKHVLSQLYLEHLHDYEEYYYRLNRQKNKNCKRDLNCGKKFETEDEILSYKRRRRNKEGERVEVHKVEDEELGQTCEQCKSGLHGEVMLLCDRCNKGWHIYCLSPPLKRIPPGNWYCFECLNSDEDSFGFVQGKQFSLEGFRRVADRVKKKWFRSANTSRMQLEQKFWDIVEGSVGELEIMYGSDLDTSVYGSGFPRATDEKPSSVDVNIWNEYCTNPWNLNNLPRLQGSMLQSVHHNIAGVMVPWLYVGMLFSSFCWHFEDHCLYSMNYLHWGEPKCWYSVPGNEAQSFEKVMRDSLPDLFEAQPDLLFQLVTMLNPSVLLAKGVPVCSILQEPGNFVITFPRSYHGGFNFGLNCAEAVNFAPADWLPHGGFGAELYRHYHKAAVLSHEELLCVAAKNDIDPRLSTYLKPELLRIYDREKAWRERLWRNGITRSSLMLSRKRPEYVGAEEDSMCVICQQFLYLSAIGCNCRPLTFVCLEHWKHLCECTPNKLRLFYRHTLADLNDLLHTVDKLDSKEAAGILQRKSCTEKDVALAKKVKGGHVTLLQLAEEWSLRACKILEHPYSRHAYVTAIEEAEQFLWAGSEMDFVREMRNNLVQAQNWAEDVRECMSMVKLWSRDRKCNIKKIQMGHINKLLKSNDVPCNVPGHLQLQEYQEEANKLTDEINSALSIRPEISVADLEILCAKAMNSPIYIPESEKLEYKLSAVKVWLDNARNCINQKTRSSVEIDILYKLEAEILDLQLQLPETEPLTVLMRKAESCQSCCSDILKNLKNLEMQEIEQFLSGFEEFTVNIPELKLLRKYYDDTTSWKCRVNLVLRNIQERGDQENVVDELRVLQRDASSLQIQVDELPSLELELTKACCRVRAIKALHNEMSMDFIQQLMSEAYTLQMEKEKLFTDLSGRLAVAMSAEEKAQFCLGNKAKISEFEDVLRASDNIGIILPSLHDVKDAMSVANVWLMKSKPFLIHDSSIVRASESCPQVDVLKELVLESEHLKIHLEECSLLDKVWKKCIDWEQDASSLLQAVEKLCNIDVIGDQITSCFIPELERQVLLIESAMKAGVSLGLEFTMIPKLEDASSMLKWFIKALSFSFVIPTSEEVGVMLDAIVKFPLDYKSCTLVVALINGLNWLRKALECLDPHGRLRLELGSVEEVLVISEKIYTPFPIIVSRLRDAIQKHNLWLEQVILFFGLNSEDRTWNVLLQLKEVGNAEAFRCSELEKILSEINKVEQWKLKCEDVVKLSMAKEIPLICTLIEIKETLDKSFDIYNSSKNGATRIFCTCYSSNVEQQEVLTCSVCKESFHRHCSTPSLEDAMLYICAYCSFVKSSILPRRRFDSLKAGQKHLELDKLVNLLSDANDLCMWNKERRILHQVVEKAHACNGFLTEIVDFALTYVAKDLTIVIGKLSIASKAMEVAAACDGLGMKKFELALARNSWKIGAEKLLESSEKPSIQQVQHYLKEGDAVNIPPEDYYRLKLAEFRNVGLQWANIAKKVSMDGGLLELNKVFELMFEGENLPVYCGKEVKLLKERSMLYCICRRPYDQRAMVACDRCNEWYHFDCVEILSAPKIYICPACDLLPNEDLCASTPITQER
ncbi:lysine-specific demethylase 5B-like [Dorcoceras hygrometricum]|uniref:Lysine-specific demethylase 5B-like n=1 Tax=Dorcoceras hygrometricum TaxID=472368 RepID=A0A2Z7BHX5_9LAMI|nr:lysine-specific demethylase 5B-like [Dorcoceras hygrometricum]